MTRSADATAPCPVPTRPPLDDPFRRRHPADAGSVDDRILAVASSQHGVVTRAQLLDAGLTSRMVDRRLESRRLHPLHRGVYLLGSLRASLEPERAREMAAVLACGKGSVVSHRSAAWLWELLPRPDSSAPVEITVPRPAQTRRPGIHARRSDDLSPGDTTTLDGIPVTTPPRTLRDLSIVIGARDLNRVAARAERRGLIQAAELSSLASRHSGRAGAPLLRAAVQVEGGLVLTRSKAEERFLDLVHTARLPRPEVNVWMRGHEVDFLWRRERLAVEVDGFGFHASRRSFEKDRLRDAELAAAGLRVVRVTWRQIVREGSATVVRVAQALARA